MPSRKVVVLLADQATQAALATWCEDNGFDLAASFGGTPRPAIEFEFHLTLFATVGPSLIIDGEYEIDGGPISVEPLGFDAFGDAASTPVMLTYLSLRLDDLRWWWLKLAAADPTYPEFRPHVSLSYAWDGAPALDDLELPDMPLVFDRLEVRTLDDKPAQKAEPSTKGILAWLSEAVGLGPWADFYAHCDHMQVMCEDAIDAIAEGNSTDARALIDGISAAMRNPDWTTVAENYGSDPRFITSKSYFEDWVAMLSARLAALPVTVDVREKALSTKNQVRQDAVARFESMTKPWIDTVDREYMFDFSEFGETREEVENELEGALDCTGALAPMIKEIVDAQQIAEVERDRQDELAMALDNIATDAQMALETAGDAVEQLQARLTQFA